MTVRSAELGHLGWVGAGTQTIFTVPSGETWLLKDVRFGTAHGTAHTLWCFITRGAGSQLVHVQALGVGFASAGLSCFIVMEPGDVFQIIPSVTPTGGDFVWCSGAMLQGVA